MPLTPPAAPDDAPAPEAAAPPPTGPAPAAPTSGSSPASPAPPPAASEPSTPLDSVALQKELEQARKDAGKARAELKKFEEAEQARADAEKTELQKAQDKAAESERRVADAERRAQEKSLLAAVHVEALRLGFRRPDKALNEIKLAEVQYDDDGEPTNVRALLEAALKDDEGLKAAAPGAPDLGQGTRGRTSLSRDQIKEMTQEQFGAAWDRGEIQEVLGRPGR